VRSFDITRHKKKNINTCAKNWAQYNMTLPMKLHIENKPHLTETELLQAQALEDVSVKNCAAVGSRALRLLVEKYPMLQSLRWVGNGPTGEEDYRAVVKLLSLRALNVSGDTGFTTKVCGELLSRSKTLRYLDVSFCSVNDEAFAEVSAPLVFLNLQGCPEITDRTLQYVARIPTLRHLLLGFNDKLTLTGLQALEGSGVQIHQARISEI